MKEQPKKSIRLWIARDHYGDLYGYINKPKKVDDYCWDAEGKTIELPDDSFPNVKWEDNEPVRAYLRLV